MSEFPSPSSSDADAVVLALETAGAMWAKGDAREALRWLRRAAESAGEAGDDLRAVTLARAAADLTAELQIPPSMPPPAMEARPLIPRAAPVPAARAASEILPELAGVAPRQALRVAVIPSDTDGALLMTRVLAEGEAVPPGAHAALLVALEPGAQLLLKKR
jgi:hypothetical protein